MTLSSDQIIAKRKDYLCPPSHVHFYKNPPHIVKGTMQYLYDDSGKKYIDFFSGVSVMNCGHSNTYIFEKTIAQLQKLQHTSIIYLTEPIVMLAEALASILPGELSRSFFTCTGSEANETALQMAKLYTGKTHILAMEGGLHGRTLQTMSVTGIPMWRSDIALLDTVHFVKRYDQADALDHLKAVIEEVGADNIAAMIVEPIQGNGGIIVPQADYLKEAHAYLKARNILLIADEVQTGFGRTGRMFACEQFGIVPDIITLAKALGNGFPISAACTHEHIANAFTMPSASTLGATPLSASTALAVLEYLEQEELCLNAETLGARLNTLLLSLKSKYPSHIIDVRGIGLMQGLELASADETDRVLEHALERGIIIGKNGLNRNVLAFQPPLVINEDNLVHLEHVLNTIFHDLFKELV